MALSEGALAVIRSWLGTADARSDAEIQGAVDLLGSAKSFVRVSLRQRLTDFLNDPASFSTAGVITANAAANIAGLERALAMLESEDDNLGWDEDEGAMVPVGLIHTIPMRRAGYRR